MLSEIQTMSSQTYGTDQSCQCCLGFLPPLRVLSKDEVKFLSFNHFSVVASMINFLYGHCYAFNFSHTTQLRTTQVVMSFRMWTLVTTQTTAAMTWRMTVSGSRPRRISLSWRTWNQLHSMSESSVFPVTLMSACVFLAYCF